MKILQINVVYRTGSTGKIVEVIHKSLTADKYESYVIYGRGKKVKFHNVMKVAPEGVIKLQSARSKITGFAFSGAFISTILLIKQIKKIKPDIVHLHVLNGYFVNIYKLMSFLKKQKIKTILTLHAEFMYTGGCGNALDCNKWKTGCGNCPQKGEGLPSSNFFDRSKKQWNLMRKAFEGFEKLKIVGVSDWITTKAELSPILKKNHIITINNGLDLDIFKPVVANDLLKKYNIQNKKIILHVTPNFQNRIKGGLYVLEIANRLLNENISVIIVGRNINIEDKPKNLIVVNNIENQAELAKFYSIADLTLLTSLSETFSMITAESLACGTPVIGFKSGAPELIALDEYSVFVEQGDLDELEKKIRLSLSMKSNNLKDIRKKAANTYSKERMYLLYKNIYEES